MTHPVEIVYTDTLKELGLGRLEGQYIEEMRNFYGEELDHLRHRLDLYDPTILMVNQSSKRFNGFQKQLLKRRSARRSSSICRTRSSPDGGNPSDGW